jgi:hypothetical protein
MGSLMSSDASVENELTGLQSSNRWLTWAAWVGVAGLGLFGIVGVFLAQVVPSTDAPVRQDLIFDNFDRPDGPESLVFPGSGWRSLAGGWSAEGGQARLAVPDLQVGTQFTNGNPPLSGLVTLDPPDGAATASMTTGAVAPGCGLAFRVRDVNNFWAVVAVPDVSTWNILRIENGTGTLVSNTSTVSVSRNSRVTVKDDGSEFLIVIDNLVMPAVSVTTISSSFLGSERSAGLSAFGDCDEARWAKFSYAG